MNTEMIELGMRAVATPLWRWKTGMEVRSGKVYGVVLEDSSKDNECWIAQFFGSSTDGGGYRDEEVPEDALPVLNSSSTLGCLLSLVRESYLDPKAHVSPTSYGEWRVWFEHDLSLWYEGKTEAEALIKALEAAPCNRT